MSSSTAMALLKGKKAPAPTSVDAELNETKKVEVVVTDNPKGKDLTEMSVKELNDLYQANFAGEVADWSKQNKEQKTNTLTELLAKHSGLADEGDEPATGKEAPQEATPEEQTEEATPTEEAPAEEPKAKAKKVSKKNATNNVIMDATNEAENLKDEESAFKSAYDLMENTGAAEFRLGAILSKISEEGWFGEYGSFKDVVVNEIGIEYRKAAYLKANYEKLVALSADAQMALTQLKYSALKEIAGIVDDENYSDWVDKALSMTNIQLHEEVLAYKKNLTAPTEGENTEPTVQKVKTMTFKVHSDQEETINAALDKAKTDMGTEVNTVALEHICMDFNAGSKKVSLPSPKEYFKKVLAKHGGDESEALKELFVEGGAFEEVFPGWTLDVNPKE